MKEDIFSDPLAKRVQMARKLLFRRDAFLVIARKPRDMIVPRLPQHVYQPVADAIAAQKDGIDATRLSLAPFMDEYYALVERGEIVESGGHFGGVDAASLYGFVRHLVPRMIIEVGCGQSTHVMRRAANDIASTNAEPPQIVCIDPVPRKDISSVADRIIYSSILVAKDVPFDQLTVGDMLFIDGSHYAFGGSDATYLFLEILPRLAPGVVVHIHDIFLPFEYPLEFTRRLYGEQYVLAPMVLDRASWQVLLPVQWEVRAGRLEARGGGGSFWMRRR